MQQDESFGIIPLKKKNGEWEVFLIQHKHARYWGFPKGHAEPNEDAAASARRELKEETNLDVVRLIQKEPLMEQYQFVMNGRHISKRVYYFIAEVSGEVVLQKLEIAAGMWLPIKQALGQLTHKEGKAILAQVEKILI